MEEEIFKIIREDYIDIITAKEITSMVMEFIKWKDNPDNVGCFDGNEVYFIFDLSEERGHTIEQVFEYWNTNIRKP